MTSGPRRGIPGLSRELNEPIRSPGMFEDIPQIPRVAALPTEPRMKNKVAIITGANSALGIGRAAAHLFASAGAKAIYICDYDDDNLEKHQREIGQLYPHTKIETRQFDAAEDEPVKAVCEDAVTKYGRLDVFFANAGISNMKGLEDLESDEFMNMMRVNLLSVFLAAKYASKAMKVTSQDKPYSSGSIIGTASVAGIRSNAGPADYSASKAGVISLAQSLSYQLAGTGIRVNAICPGIIETGMTQIMYDMARAKGTERKIGQLNPLRRGGVADEVARVALFLASDESSYVNGQHWAVDGGLSAGHPFVPGKMA